MDAYSRRIVGWSIDSRQDRTLVVNARDMAIRNRRPEPGEIVHADHGVQFTSWASGNKIRSAGLMHSSSSNLRALHAYLGHASHLELMTLR